MNTPNLEREEKILRNSKSRRKWIKVLCIISCLVFIFTTYAMILPGMTLETSEDTFCGIESHTHTDECYEIPGVPEHDEITCTVEHHIHTQDCYDAYGNVACGYSDGVIHSHTDLCFDDNGNLICPLQEYNGEYHQHSNECYDAYGNLICGLLETAVHQHTEECRHTVAAVEPQNLICGKTEHTHTAECFNCTEKDELLPQATDKTELISTTESETGTDSIHLSKKIDYTDAGYILRLETYVTGTTVITETIKPVDVVLVLDVSGSMDYSSVVVNSKDTSTLDKKAGATEGYYTYLYSEGYWGDTYYDMRYANNRWEYTSDSGKSWKAFSSLSGGESKICIHKMTALQYSVNNFIDGLYATKSTANNKIAIVKFASDSSDSIGDTTYYGSGYTQNHSQILFDMAELTKDNVSDIKKKVNALKGIGATRSDYGMNYAKKILAYDSVKNDGNNKFVVFFTDGVPTTSDTYSDTVANAAISYANEIKKTAKVYTIGLFDSLTTKAESYMNYVSSNYPDAKSQTEYGTKKADTYFNNTADVSKLNAIFESVRTEIGAAGIQLDDTTVLRDVLTDSFWLDIDESQPSTSRFVSVHTETLTKDGWVNDNNGPLPSGITLTVKAKTGADELDTVDVSGFDYAANYVDTSIPRGKKIVVELPIAYIGGEITGYIETNDPSSGIYIDGKPLKMFEQPLIHIPATVNMWLELLNNAEDNGYAATVSDSAEKVVYYKDETRNCLEITGLTTLNYTLYEHNEGDTNKKTFYCIDDKDDEIDNNDIISVTNIPIPDGYTIKVYRSVDGGTEQEVPVTIVNKIASFEFVPLNTTNLRIVLDRQNYVYLTVKNEIVNRVADQKFKYTVTYVDYDGSNKKEEFELYDGVTYTFAIPANHDIKIVESNYDGYSVQYMNADKTSTLQLGDTYIQSYKQDTLVIAQNICGVVLPSTGGTGTAVYVIIGCALVLLSLAGITAVGIYNKKRNK